MFLRKKNYFIIRSKQQLDPPPLQPNLKLLTRGLLNFICLFRKKYVFLFRTLHYWLLINMILFWKKTLIPNQCFCFISPVIFTDIYNLTKFFVCISMARIRELNKFRILRPILNRNLIVGETTAFRPFNHFKTKCQKEQFLISHLQALIWLFLVFLYILFTTYYFQINI